MLDAITIAALIALCLIPLALYQLGKAAKNDHH